MGDAEGPSPARVVRSAVWIFVSMTALAAALTILFLSMRSVMRVGGACGSGNPPFVIATPCPKGIPLLMIGSIWGGLVFAGIYTWQSIRAGGPTLIGFAWPALFLSLGYNFLEYGLKPPTGHGPIYGWLIPGVLFVIMGGVPLAFLLRTLRSSTTVSSRVGRASAAMMRLRVPAPATPSLTPTTEQDYDVVKRLEALADLHARGELTAEQYEAAKQTVIEGGGRR